MKMGDATTDRAAGMVDPSDRRKTKPFHITDLDARLLDTAVPTRTRVWEARVPLECAYCEETIPANALFTRALLPGFGRTHQNLCSGCRRFQVRYE